MPLVFLVIPSFTDEAIALLAILSPRGVSRLVETEVMIRTHRHQWCDSRSLSFLSPTSNLLAIVKTDFRNNKDA